VKKFRTVSGSPARHERETQVVSSNGCYTAVVPNLSMLAHTWVHFSHFPPFSQTVSMFSTIYTQRNTPHGFIALSQRYANICGSRTTPGTP